MLVLRLKVKLGTLEPFELRVFVGAPSLGLEN